MKLSKIGSSMWYPSHETLLASGLVLYEVEVERRSNEASSSPFIFK